MIPDESADAPPAEGGANPVTVSGSDFRQTLLENPVERRRGLLADHVTALVAKVMGLDSPHALDPKAGFFHFGMDSLMSVTLQRALSSSLGIEVPASVVFDYPTVEALVGHLATTLPELDEESPDQRSGGTDDYDRLTEDELFQLLSERLGSTP